MNPVLLKPQSEIGAQVVVQGRVIGNATARDYQALKPKLMAAVLDSFARLQAEADLVLVEGAGSAAEINLRAGRHRQHGLRPRRRLSRSCWSATSTAAASSRRFVGTKAVLEPEDAR